MIRFLVAFGIGLVFGVSGLVAAEHECLDEPLSVTGKPSAIGELARANAFFTWKSVAKEKYGPDYMAWSAASERKLVCVDLMSGEDKCKWECTRISKPCKRSADLKAEQGAKCDKQVVEAYGARRSTRPGARNEAVAGWVLTIERNLGEQWADWTVAQQKSIACHRKNNKQYQCVARALACTK